MSIWASLRPLAQINGTATDDMLGVMLDDIPARDDDGTPYPDDPSWSFDVATTWFPTVRFTVRMTGSPRSEIDVQLILTAEECRELAGRLLLAAAAAERVVYNP
jgi:hypothetical protein